MNINFDYEPFIWEVKIVTLSEFITKCIPRIDLNPIHQRVNVENIGTETAKRKEPSKRQGIIESILSGIDIGEISINVRTEEETEKWLYPEESLDGGHRKRSIKEFFNNEFALSSGSSWGYKKFSQLPTEIQQRFLDYKIRLWISLQLTPAQKADQFQKKNTTTPVNLMEYLNGYGDIPVANAVRETSRYIGGDIANTPHELFTIKEDRRGKVIGQYLSFDPSRLTYDKLVSRLFYVTLLGDEKPCPCDDDQLVSMYKTMYRTREFDSDIADAKTKVLKCLDFIMQFGNAKREVLKGNSKIKSDEFVMLFRLYYTYKNRWGNFKGGWKIQQWEEFYRRFARAFAQFDKRKPSKFGLEPISNTKKHMLRFDVFNKNHQQFTGVRHWTDNVVWLEQNHMTPEELINDGVIVVLDKKRTYTKAERELGIIHNNFKDPIDGSDLNLDNSHGGHKLAHAKGNLSNMDNLVALKKEYNLQQGTEDYDTFVSRLRETLKKNLAKKSKTV